MRIAYADPPYIGCAHLYRDHADYAGEVDHEALARQLFQEFDGFILHGSSTSIGQLASHVLKPETKGGTSDVRCMAWVKGFAAFKRNVSVAYAWEPVYVRAARKPVVSARQCMRDWIECPITLRKGLAGVKPEKVCWWAFEMVGARPDDDLVDLFPGTGAVTKAWERWRKLFTLPTTKDDIGADVSASA